MRTGRTASAFVAALVGATGLGLLSVTPVVAQITGVQVEEPDVSEIDVFDLDLEAFREVSRLHNFEIVAHDYLKVFQYLTPLAQEEDVGAGINTLRVYDGIAYLGGYNGPPTMFGTLIVDVSDPENMEPLSFVPCEIGTRCPYIRVNREKKILAYVSGRNAANPDQPPEGTLTNSGWSFWDVSDPRNPVFLSHLAQDGNTSGHGMEMDDRYVYGCGQTTQSVSRDEVQIIDYSDPSNPFMASTWHVPGQHEGEEFGPMDRANPDGTPQIISCHEIVLHNDRLYVAYRDAGMVILDVTDRTNPQLIAQYDYVPPFHGGSLGAAHTSQPVITDPDEHPDLVLHTDEIFTCPPGFGRVIDVSDLKNPEVINGEREANVLVLSTFRLSYIADNYDHETGEFVCSDAQDSAHLIWPDMRSPSLYYVAWYNHGLRAWDISNPFVPTEVGYYISPRFEFGEEVGRHTREAFQDRDTGLIYVTDGNGGGLTVLRYTGPIPEAPIPGAR